MSPEDLLHLFGPFLPTDRFRALLRGQKLPTTTHGVAMIVDISGFTPLAARLVDDYGPRRASEELKRRLNPMLEATAGQVFQHGGSVIRFVGDGFLAWFDDQPSSVIVETPVPTVLRATAAAFNMQSLMPIFHGLSLKIAIAPGTSYRWIVGQAQHGLNDVLSGPAVEAMVQIIEHVEPGETLVAATARDTLTAANVRWQLSETVASKENGVVHGVIVKNVPNEILDLARQYRWPAWQIEADSQEVLDAVRPFVASALRASIEDGFGDFVGELRQAFPMFIRVNSLMAVNDSGSDSRLVLDQYVSDVQDVLAETGGRLVSVEVSDKGSVLFAVFGAPVSYGDDAERALAAAMTLRDLSVSKAGLMTSDGFSPQIGISLGPLYAGVVGGEVRHEYSTIGDETNVAARLMLAALPGQILVSSRVQDEVRRRIVFRDLPSIQVKGKEKPIAVSEPMTLSRDISPYVTTGELIGRNTELTLFKKLIKSVESGLPRIVQIEGPAGIGKSRLADEFSRLSTIRKFQTVGGECLNTGRNIPYLPWRKLLSTLLFNVTQDLPSPLSAELLTERLVNANPDWLLRLPLLGDLLQIAFIGNSTLDALSESARQQALSTLVTELIVYFSRIQPIMVLIENVQWIDELSENILMDLARYLSVEPAPVLLVLTHRPMTESEQELTIGKVLAEMYIYARLLVSDLSREETELFIEHRLEAPPPLELTRFVYEQARGNPFFIQEVLDTLEETTAIRVRNHRVRIERNLDAVDLPQTVQGLIQSRIDRLSEGEKLVLKIASVVGRQFQVQILAACVPLFMSQAQLLAYLRSLEEHDFIHQESADQELIYNFNHAITHDVAYQGLLFDQRRQLHQAVGMALETLQPTNIQQLAFHFVRSGNEHRVRARGYLQDAAQNAIHEYANQSALDYLDQALVLANDPEDLFEIHQRRIDVLLRIGQIERVSSELAEMQLLAETNRRPDWAAQLFVIRARFMAAKGDWQTVQNEASQALVFAKQINNDLLSWDALLLLSEACRNLGDPQADEILRRDVRIMAERLNDPHKDIQLLLKEIADLAQYHPAAAMVGARNLLKYTESMNDVALAADCWALIAELARAERDLPIALESFKQELTRLRRIGNRRREGQTLNNIGLVLIDMGQFSDANTHLQQAYTILHQIGERRGWATSLNGLGVIANFRGAFEEALAYLNRGLEQMRELVVPGDIALNLMQIGCVRLRMSDLTTAELLLKEALTLFETLRWPIHIAEVRTALSEVALQNGDIALAQNLSADLLPALQAGKVNELQRPGLAYWRTIQVFEQSNEPEKAVQLREAYRRYHESILAKLIDPDWKDAYNSRIWYHKALFGTLPTTNTNIAKHQSGG